MTQAAPNPTPESNPTSASNPHGVPPGVPHASSSGGSIAMLILGLLFVVLGIGPLIGGASIVAILAQQDDDGFVSSPAVGVAADSYALTSPDQTVASDVPQMPLDIGTIRLSATGQASAELFIGVARQDDVDAYLAGVHHTEVAEVRLAPQVTRLRDHPGEITPDLPGNQDFWIASDTGRGSVELERPAEFGDWAIVVMNADATPGVQVALQAGFRSDWFWPLAAGLFIAGLLLCLIGLPLLILGVIGIGRRLPSGPSPSDVVGYPARLTGELIGTPSSWLWLVKWLLAIPHYVVLVFLWFAFAIASVVAWFAILFTGRYPRPLFNFNVGVLRWSWRVGFYAYSALGTDKYPPFSLAATSYPADFTIEYPQRLSRGLIFVKSWLLALPHLLLIGAVTGSSIVFARPAGGWGRGDWTRGDWAATEWSPESFIRVGGISIVGLLVLVVGVSLLFRSRYPVALFNLLMGINRWGYRVAAYVGLFRDEYPPFRLDQGPRDTEDTAKAAPPQDSSPQDSASQNSASQNSAAQNSRI
ncbi:uncharacterized protein DUF4389 [Glaciihabitans tibetensis]|uniref:Uncharacterized protein DUF4389 n=1 Tax=Glaciihabitans tibetensis TaxID=1266600 RepID=A0A2T0VK26_9MICO|nr:DUF4389 domain-containing protein [Glaciihabitans tibetensis]PRY70586.1 uncharacterized protein DUF4389 [Glaciihabitans tibetensis]